MNKLVFLFFMFLSFSIYAKPVKLSVEGLTTEHKDLKLEASSIYVNRTSTQIESIPTQISIGDGVFVSVPGAINEFVGNTDTLIGTLNFRYGILPLTEINTRFSGFTKQIRVQNEETGRQETINSNGFLDAWVGITQTLSPDTITPALLLSLETSVYQKNNFDSSSFNSWRIGLSSYRTIDPIVLLISASYDFYSEINDGISSVNPGNILTITPSFSFAVNDRITIFTGVQWLNKQSSTVENIVQNQRLTSTNLELGANLLSLNNFIWGFSLTSFVSGEGGSNFKLKFSKDL